MKDLKIISFITVVGLIAFISETTIFAFPIIFFMGAIMLTLYKKIYMYVMVLVFAFIIDSLRVSNFGYTPLFLVATISIIMMYENYSGSKDLLISAIIIGMMGFIYTHFMSYSLLLTFTFYLIVVIMYGIFNFLNNKKILPL